MLGTFLVYAATFLGVFTAVFYLLTLAEHEERPRAKGPLPTISVIIPVWNEGGTERKLCKTIDSLLAVDYPAERLQIIVVDDGSTDDSFALAQSYAPRVQVFRHRTPQGKTAAVNKGLRHASGELVAALDADAVLAPDVLKKLVVCFREPRVMAAIPSIKIWKPRGLLQRIQFQEFLSAVFIRHLQAELGAVPLAPGAFTLVRKSFIDRYGPLDTDTMVEDLELSLRIQSHHYLIEHVIDANVYTQGARTLSAFIRQRIRWFLGFIIQLTRYRNLFSKKYGNLGVFILPSAVAFVLLSILLLGAALLETGRNLFTWVHVLRLTGFSWQLELPELFYITLSNKTVLPIILLFTLLLFMYYTKRVSKEPQGIFLSFIVFSATYWFLGGLCWVLALTHYVMKRPVRWGPKQYVQ